MSLFILSWISVRQRSRHDRFSLDEQELRAKGTGRCLLKPQCGAAQRAACCPLATFTDDPRALPRARSPVL